MMQDQYPLHSLLVFETGMRGCCRKFFAMKAALSPGAIARIMVSGGDKTTETTHFLLAFAGSGELTVVLAFEAVSGESICRSHTCYYHGTILNEVVAVGVEKICLKVTDLRSIVVLQTCCEARPSWISARDRNWSMGKEMMSWYW